MPACVKAKKYPGWKEEVSSEDPNDQEIAFMPGHKLVHITGHKRACAYCNILRLKTKSGWAIKSYYKCEACDVCLCKGKKDCFLRYHELRMEQPDLSPKMLLKTLKEATASQAPKKSRKNVKTEEGYSPKQSLTSYTPKYEEFTSMLSQSISDQLMAYGGMLDPDQNITPPSLVAPSVMPPNLVTPNETHNSLVAHKVSPPPSIITEDITIPNPLVAKKDFEKQHFITVDPKDVNTTENGPDPMDSAESNIDVPNFDETNSDSAQDKETLPIKEDKTNGDETADPSFSPNQQEYLL